MDDEYGQCDISDSTSVHLQKNLNPNKGGLEIESKASYDFYDGCSNSSCCFRNPNPNKRSLESSSDCDSINAFSSKSALNGKRNILKLNSNSSEKNLDKRSNIPFKKSESMFCKKENKAYSLKSEVDDNNSFNANLDERKSEEEEITLTIIDETMESIKKISSSPDIKNSLGKKGIANGNFQQTVLFYERKNSMDNSLMLKSINDLRKKFPDEKMQNSELLHNERETLDSSSGIGVNQTSQE